MRNRLMSRRRLLCAGRRRRRRFRRAARAIQLDWRLFRRQRRPRLGQSRRRTTATRRSPRRRRPGFEDVFGPGGPLERDRRRPPSRSAIADGYLPRQPRRLVQHVRRRWALSLATTTRCSRWSSGFEADLGLGRRRAFDRVRRAAEYRRSHPMCGPSDRRLEWLGTARLRAGYAFDRALIFATGGLAYGGVKAESSASEYDGSNTDVFAGSASGTKVGYALGGGLEYAFATQHVAEGRVSLLRSRQGRLRGRRRQ